MQLRKVFFNQFIDIFMFSTRSQLLRLCSRSGTAIMQDGNTMRNNYGCDLDSLTTGSRIGMMRSASGDLHYYINGVDQGVACSGLPPGAVELKPPLLLLLLLTPVSLNTTELTWFVCFVSLRGVCCDRPVRPVCPGINHHLIRPAGQQPLHQQHH